MSKSTKRLGRGLNSLVSDLRAQATKDQTTPEAMPAAEGESAPQPRTAFVDPEELSPNPYQPRVDITSSDLITLTRSIEQSGILQPITVRRSEQGYQVIAGERRLRAAQSLGMKSVPVIVREATDDQMLELALIENIHREDLNAIDRAAAYRRFCDRFELKPGEVADRVGEDRTTVVNYLRLLDLEEPLQELVAQRALSMGHARCLLGVEGSDQRFRLADAVVKNDLSVRALEEIVRRERKRRTTEEGVKTASGKLQSAHLADLQRRFEEVLKTKVVIHEGRRKGKGRIIVDYYTNDDFERIASMLGVDPADDRP